MIGFGAGGLEKQATPGEVQDLFDAMAVRLKLDDAMPSPPDIAPPMPAGTERYEMFDQDALVELIPLNGLRRLAVRMRSDVLDRATVIRERPLPEIAGDAYSSEIYRLSVGDDGRPRIEQSIETYREATEEEPTSLDDFLEAAALDEATGADRVDSDTCRELATQISQTRVSPIRRIPYQS